MRLVGVDRRSLLAGVGTRRFEVVVDSRPPVAAESNKGQGPNKCPPTAVAERNSKTFAIVNTRL